MKVTIDIQNSETLSLMEDIEKEGGTSKEEAILSLITIGTVSFMEYVKEDLKGDKTINFMGIPYFLDGIGKALKYQKPNTRKIS